jgi:DNA-binding transcriptional ArsR family regulator
VKVSDATTLRALAHPLRFELLDLIANYGPLTATQCSGRVDESPSNCSFHLRVLARAGLLEEAPGSVGRNRLWRVVDSQQIIDPDPEDPSALASAAELAAAQLEWEVQRIRRSGSRRGAEEWATATTFGGSSLRLTAEEAASVIGAVEQVLESFRRRQRSADFDPTGTRPIRFLFASSLIDDGTDPEPASETDHE